MNVIIPMAGLGQRFSSSGFLLPKPLIKMGRKPMYRYAVDCMPLSMATNLIFVVRKSQYSDSLIQDIRFHYEDLITYSIVVLEQETQGQAETVLKSASYLNLEIPTLVHNCDTYIDLPSLHWKKLLNKNIDGALVLFKSNEERWSYAKLNQNQTQVIDVQEKKVISNHASTGTYFFKDTKVLLEDIEKIIYKNERENNEFYLSTVYRAMLQEKKCIIPLWAEHLLCFGTPQDLVCSLNHLLLHPSENFLQ